LTGKKWLENREKEPPKPPAENFPKQPPNNPEPDIISNKPVISAEKPTNQDNSLLTTKKGKNFAITNYQPKSAISEIPPRPQGKISLNTSEQLPITTNKREPSTTNEEILLTKIKDLEKQLARIQTENSNLKLENKHLKGLIRQEQETEAKMVQLLTYK